MSDLARTLWSRATEALGAARQLLGSSPDGASSRAYYAAFYAVSALFALKGRTFRKHTAVETAVHRDLVRTGLWPPDLGERYSALIESRTVGDYGGLDRVSPSDAVRAVGDAEAILRAVAAARPDVFSLLGRM